MKIKGDEYVRLHRILTGFSNKDIWEMLRNGDNLNMFLSSVPDEFDAWVKRIIRDLEDKHSEILGYVITDFWEIDNELIQEQLQLGDDLVFDEREYAKKYAEKAFTKKYPHLLFSYRKEILNPINTSKAIWDLIRPKYEKPFWNKKEGE
jgi:hypothetical protein